MTHPGPYGQQQPQQGWPQQAPQQAQGGWQQPAQGAQPWQQQAPQQPAVKTTPASLGPLTWREWGIVAMGVLALGISFLPVISVSGGYGDFGFSYYAPVWTLGFANVVFTTVLPIAVAVLVLVRRLAVPNLRVGGFGVDQLVSIAGLIAFITWLGVAIATAGGAPQWIGQIVGLGLIFFGNIARVVPGLKDDFENRPALAADPSTLGVRAIERTAGAQFGQPQHTGAAPQYDPNATGAVFGQQPTGAVPSFGQEQPGWSAQAPAQQTWGAPTAAQPTWGAQPEQAAAPTPAPAWGEQQQSQPQTWGAQPEQAQTPVWGAPTPAVSVEAEEVIAPNAADASAALIAEQAAAADAADADAVADADVVADAVEVEAVADDAAAPVEGDAVAEVEAAAEADVEAEVAGEVADVAATPVAAGDAGPVPFWALAPVERDVVDEAGTPLFRVGPTAWALVVEVQPNAYVIRHEDGRTGRLNDISGVIRG